MKVIHKPRRSGKTTELLKYIAEDIKNHQQYLIIVPLCEMKKFVFDLAISNNIKIDNSKIITFKNFIDLCESNKLRNENLYFDELGLSLNCFSNSNNIFIKAITISDEGKNE